MRAVAAVAALAKARKSLNQAMKRVPKAETYHAVTDDGWRIALDRYPRPGRRCPVLLVHGPALNRHNFDFPDEDISFAKYLWARDGMSGSSS
jgi:hypothetical protein